MPGFLTKLFRRKNSGSENATAEPKQRASQRKVKQQARKEKEAKQTPSKKEPAAQVGPKDEEDRGLVRRTPSFTATTTTSGRESSGSREQPSYSTAKTTKKLPSSKVLSPRTTTRPKTPRAPTGPVDLDDTDFEESDRENDENRDRSNLNDAGLSFQQLQQFNMQQPVNTASHGLYVMSDTNSTGFKNPKDDANQSESSHSEFNLSTDAEDEEYNSMKRKVASYNANAEGGLDTSAMNYTTDDDHIFPALQTDDEHDPATPDDEPGPIRIVSIAADPEEDMRAWGLSPSTSSSGKENGSSPRYKSATKKSPETPRSASRRNFTTPAPADNFANFASFDANFDNAFPDAAMPVHTPSNSSQLSSRSRRQLVDDEPLHNLRPSGARRISSSASATGDSSLTDLLAQAKQVGRSRREPSSSSVNSAPAITTQYLRQYHGIGSSARSDTKSVNDTSVSDIISSLEATNAARLRTSSRSRSNRSVGSRDSGANASTRSARRRRESSSRRSKVGSDESEENDPSESWLFDEVTGALGPRGVAADMESLSGRSKNSHKSHRSHRSSHRRRRHKSSSNESVDSRGSKNSRNSRYSHKSTRSYLSQMSEQSRSVANDLLRLEMQLAMVGSQENGDEAPVVGRTGGSVGGSVGGGSRASRTSRKSSATTRSSAITKRSKISVVAPPGKLGIILANKADSKGTVVSGVRTSSVLAEKISPGDRIIAIDGEDVSRMTVSEITTIMARKTEFERSLTVLTTPKHMTRNGGVDPDGTSYTSSPYRR
jgi:hypothetical protein